MSRWVSSWKDVTHRNFESDFSRKLLDLIEAELYRRVVRGVILPMPKQWAYKL